MIWGKIWRGYDGEDDMTDGDWAERGSNCAKGMINGLPPQGTCPDEGGTPTYGWYNGDFSEEEHNRANYLLEEDPEYAEEQAEAGREVLGFWNWWNGETPDE